ncbi:hypothetical protein [Oceanimonas baumannii]|uniref:Uncharacterized protein n=1 Tax=Oceanimonas baumannii TaxID=129578 RepID=A0A235CNK0_9GAMM|nr:hypothetical protein [Oceanimonas baumannii]MCC4263144.1 hypothetical protein [Oceanimonas baumannii]OYD25944.1 hypothetical protein B6S09_03645 [Oceanimonas baumannii]TDW60037.1 hypothetical protein LY04_01029 [Oceanimonas baumannii]
MPLSEREHRELVSALRRILDHYGVDYRQSPESYNYDTLYDHQCRLILDEVATSWQQHYGYRPSPLALQKALFAAEHSRRFSPPWYKRLITRFSRKSSPRPR